MQNAVNFVAGDTVPFGHSNGALQIQPGTGRDTDHVRKIAGLRFSRMTIIGRAALFVFAMVMAGVTLVVAFGRTLSAPQALDLPAVMYQGNVGATLSGCALLQHMYFNCTREINGEAVTSVYDDSTNSTSYSSESIRKLILGDLIAAWGTPEGITHYYQESMVIWGSRSALFGVCALRPDSRVIYLEHGFSHTPSIPWRGFVSHFPKCTYGQ